MRSVGGRAYGPIRKEGRIRAAGALLLIALVAGCGTPEDKPKAQLRPKQDAPTEPRQVNTGEAEATRWSEDVPPQPLWKVRWGTATLEFGAGGQFGGSMRKVGGSMFEGATEASRFNAERATADKSTGNLLLSGNVVLVSLQHKATLRCDEVRYSSNERGVVRAVGNVRIDGDWGRVEGMDELHATTDLSRFGTPALFTKP